LSGLRKSRRSYPPGRKRRRVNSRRCGIYPTTVLLNGNIVTMDAALPSAQAIALNGDRIAAIGSSTAISQLAGPDTLSINLKGATVLPGFIDCHIHLVEYGLSLRNLDLRDTRSVAELKQRVSVRAGEVSSWILGRGWDQEKFAEKRYPTRQDLDEASPLRPVLLRRVCGHICVVNSVAMHEASITASTPDPKGGIIDRDTAGEPTGILRENAVELIERSVPAPSLEDYERGALAACEKAVEAGLTTVHCIVSSEAELRALLKLRADGRLPLRFYVFVPPEQMKAASQLGLMTGFGDEWVRLGGVKVFTDGSLGARTAALEAPYSDDPLNRGVTIYSQEQLDALIFEAHRADMQAAVHAIGDRAAGMALESIAKAKNRIPGKDLRHRIEHASVLNPQLIRRLKEIGLIASVQPHFVVSDFWVGQRLGEDRARFAYSFSSLLKAGVVAVGGSDCPVEPLAPLSGIAAAVNRSDREEALSIEDAIEFYTRNAAYASFDEKVKGTISPGKYADIVVLEKDPRKVPASKIAETKIMITIVGGKIKYSSPSFLKILKEKEKAAQ